jgi:hypothetical protein
VIPIAFPAVLAIFAVPSVPSTKGMIITVCDSCPRACISRPTNRLKVWSVPPNSTSAPMTTESCPCSMG